MSNMKTLLIPVVVAALLVSAAAMPGHAQSPEDVTFILPIRGMVENALVHVVRRGLAQAEHEKATAIVFVLDTPGGKLGATDKIVKMMEALTIPAYTFVENDAISAGTIIALATEHIYMSPGSKIGDIIPILLSPLGTPQEMPESIEEKQLTYLRALVRSLAQQNGHDEALVEAMVDRNRVYTIGDEVLCPEGEVITLTNVEAERFVGEGENRHRLLSEGTVADLDELLETIGRAHTRRVTQEITNAERIARFIELPLVSSLLLIVGGLGLYIEFKTPGFGLPGIAGIVGLTIFFWGHHVAGLAGWEELVVFAIGFGLLALEIFVIPGFGLAGGAGILLMLGALLAAMVPHYQGVPAYSFSWPDLQSPLQILASSILIATILALLLGKILPKTPIYRWLVLASPQERETDTDSAQPDLLLGQQGTTQTDLRPAGTALFGERRLNVVSRGGYINRNAPVHIVELAGNHIVVELADQQEAAST